MSEHKEALAALHTTLIDSRLGYEEALKDAGNRGLVTLFQEMIALRQAAAIELERFLRQAGLQPEADGSFLSTVHRTIISLQSLFNDLDESILPGLIDGEKRILGYYDDALKSATGEEADVLSRQKQEVVDRIAEMQRRNQPAA